MTKTVNLKVTGANLFYLYDPEGNPVGSLAIYEEFPTKTVNSLLKNGMKVTAVLQK